MDNVTNSPGSNNSTTNHQVLAPFQLTQLLVDLERTGGRRQKSFVSLICSQNPEFYGERGSALRSLFRKQRDLFKRQLIGTYLKTLITENIKPAESTLEEAKVAGVLTGDLADLVDDLDTLSLEDTTSLPTVLTTKSPLKSSLTKPTSKALSMVQSSDSDDDSSGLGFADKKAKKKSVSKASASSRSSKNQQKKSSKEDLIFPSSVSVPTMTLPVNSTTVSASINSSLSNDLRVYYPDGSKERPYLIMANGQRPEAHGDFYILGIENHRNGGWLRSIFEMRKSIPLQDADEWVASVPSFEDNVPLAMNEFFAGRVVLIKGPSADHYQRSATLINNRSNEECLTTAGVREAAANEIKGNDERGTSHYLIVFPEGTELNNAAFSENNLLRRKFVGFREPNSSYTARIDPDDENSDRESLHGFMVVFQVALKGGRQCENQENGVNTSQYLAP